MTRDKAYDMIDHFLSNNVDSDDFEPYRAALDVLWNPTPEHAAVIAAAVAMADQIPVSASYSEWLRVKDGLLTAVATLRKLEGEA